MSRVFLTADAATPVRRGRCGTPPLLACAALVAVSTFAPGFACAQRAATAGSSPVKITFYNYNLAYVGAGAEATRKLLREFMQAHPDVTVTGVGVAAPDFVARVQADIVARLPVDLAQMAFGDLDFAVHNLGAQALENLIPAAELAAHFSGLSPVGLRLGVLEGKTYGLAYTFSTPVLFYNADLFRAAGLDPARPPADWAAVKQAALAIKKKTGKGGFASGIFGPNPGDWLLQGLVRSNGGEVISRDRKTLEFASPASVGAVAMLRDLYASGAMENLNGTNAAEALAAGNLGMLLQSSAVQNSLIIGARGKFELRDSTMPSFGSKPARPTNSGSALVILTNDPAKQRAAWELMRFLTSKHGYTVITSEIGYLPLRTDIVSDPNYLGGWVKTHPLVQPNLEQLSVLEPWEPMPGPNYRRIVKVMMDGVETSVIGGADAAATLAAAQRTAQALMPN
jgi:multiple sugar transport system substrate-binding protein